MAEAEVTLWTEPLIKVAAFMVGCLVFAGPVWSYLRKGVIGRPGYTLISIGFVLILASIFEKIVIESLFGFGRIELAELRSEIKRLETQIAATGDGTRVAGVRLDSVRSDLDGLKARVDEAIATDQKTEDAIAAMSAELAVVKAERNQALAAVDAASKAVADLDKRVKTLVALERLSTTLGWAAVPGGGTASSSSVYSPDKAASSDGYINWPPDAGQPFSGLRYRWVDGAAPVLSTRGSEGTPPPVVPK